MNFIKEHAALMLVLAVLFLSMGAVGYVNHQAIDDCIKAGNSPETCYATVNP